eukprot:743168-Pelagomonas_calceolata.AAC.2
MMSRSGCACTTDGRLCREQKLWGTIAQMFHEEDELLKSQIQTEEQTQTDDRLGKRSTTQGIRTTSGEMSRARGAGQEKDMIRYIPGCAIPSISGRKDGGHAALLPPNFRKSLQRCRKAC